MSSNHNGPTAYESALLYIAGHYKLSFQTIIEQCMATYKHQGLTLEVLGKAFHDYLAHPEKVEELRRL